MDTVRGEGNNLSKKKNMTYEEAKKTIQSLMEKWTDTTPTCTKMSVETLSQRILDLTQDIHSRTTPEDYESIIAWMESELVYDENCNKVVDTICNRLSPFLSAIFSVLAFYLGLLTGQGGSNSEYVVLIYCGVLIVLSVLAAGFSVKKQLKGSYKQERTFYELLHKSLNRRAEQHRPQETKE